MRTTLASILALTWVLALLVTPGTKLIHLLLIGALAFFVWNLAARYTAISDD